MTHISMEVEMTGFVLVYLVTFNVCESIIVSKIFSDGTFTRASRTGDNQDVVMRRFRHDDVGFGSWRESG